MKDWEAFLPEEERAIYRSARMGRRQGLGRRPALLVIDCTFAFTGTRPLPIEEAIAEYETSCAPMAWQTLPRIRRLIDGFRERQWPVVYTRGDPKRQMATKRSLECLRSQAAGSPAGAAQGSQAEAERAAAEHRARGFEFPEIIAPAPGEWIVEKSRASAFFGTPLSAYLVQNGVDSVVVCGVSTSGCVRASAVDAFSHGYPVVVVDDCCFDRALTPHLANLWDLNAKYADVLSLDELFATVAV